MSTSYLAHSANDNGWLHLFRDHLLGAYLVEFEQRGLDRARYGAGLLKTNA